MHYLFTYYNTVRYRIKIKVNRFRIYYLKTLYRGRFITKKGTTIDNFFIVNFDVSNSKIFIGNEVIFRKLCFMRAEKNGIISIGDNTFFNNGCSLNCLAEIKIGNNCLFGENVKIYDHNHSYREKSTLIRQQGYSIGKINIGNNCWLGSNVTILMNVNIGDNVIIGAGCVIYSDVPSNTVLIDKQEFLIRSL